jgi:hypothetical protein
MRRAYEGKLVFSVSGNLVAIATGSDFCAEHEHGAKPLMTCLTNHADSEGDIIAALKNGEHPDYPKQLETKRIVKFPDTLVFEVKEGDVPEATLAFMAYSRRSIADYENELRFIEDVKRQDPNLACAWSDRDFGIRVRGKKYVRGLKAFYEALRAGNVVFAGKFFQREGERLSGLVLADLTKLGEKDKAAAAEAQVKWESELRLKARSEANDISCALNQVRNVGHIWPMWKDGTESEVVYGLNPGHAVDADYWGPYSKEQLLAWGKAKFSYRLTPGCSQDLLSLAVI